jgi:malic enzyme
MSDPARFLPIVYDPTIGEACLKFGHIYRQTRGMYLSTTRRGRVKEVLRNWPQKDVREVLSESRMWEIHKSRFDFICVTDGGRILGLAISALTAPASPSASCSSTPPVRACRASVSRSPTICSRSPAT